MDRELIFEFGDSLLRRCHTNPAALRHRSEFARVPGYDAEEIQIVDYHRKVRVKDEFAPITPGEMLKEEFLVEYGLSQNQLAKAIGISPNRIAEIVNNRRRITADTALRLGLYFGNSPEFWLNLQTLYDLKMARKNLSPQAVARIKAQRAA